MKLDSNQTFWVTIWAGLALFITVLCGINYAYIYNKKQLITELINSGISPMKAHCALEMSHSNKTECALLEVVK